MVILLKAIAILLSILSAVVIGKTVSKLKKIHKQSKDLSIALGAVSGLMLFIFVWSPLIVIPYINRQADRVAKEFSAAITHGTYDEYAKVSRKYFPFTYEDRDLQRGYQTFSNLNIGQIDPDKDMIFAGHYRRPSGSSRNGAQITDHYYLFKHNDRYVAVYVKTAGLTLKYEAHTLGGGSLEDVKSIPMNGWGSFGNMLPKDVK